MKRSPMKQSTKPMARTKAMKRGAKPKMTPIRASARDEACTLCIPGVCNRDASTTVLCHSNFLSDGKGMGLKAPDTAAAYGCSACHDLLDGRRKRPSWMTLEMLQVAFANAVCLTHRRLQLKGLMK